jgi:hypothetical protein
MHNGTVDRTSLAPPDGPGSDRSRRYALLDAAFLDDPYPTYRELRELDPVYRDRRFLGWIVSRCNDVQAVLRDPTVSSRRPLADESIPRSLEPIADELRDLRRRIATRRARGATDCGGLMLRAPFSARDWARRRARRRSCAHLGILGCGIPSALAPPHCARLAFEGTFPRASSPAFGTM